MLKLNKFVLSQVSRSYGTNLFAKKSNEMENEIDGHIDNKSKIDINRERCLNMVQIIGRVGQDPKIGGHLDADVDGFHSSSEKTKKVVMFSLATNEFQGADKQGDPKTRVDWHRVAVFAPKLQDSTEKYVRQGDSVHVTGRLHYNMVKDKSGSQRYVSSVVADDIIFLGKSSVPDSIK